MPNEQLLTYIRDQRAGGVADDAIRASLLETGWQAVEVEAALGMTAAPAVAATAAAGTIAAVGMTLGAKIAVVSAAVLGVAALGGGGYYAYRTVFQPKLTPEQVIQKMMKASQDIKALEHETTIDVVIEPRTFPGTTERTPERAHITIGGSGAADMRDPDPAKRRLSETVTLRVDAADSGNGVFSLETKTIGKTTFLRLRELAFSAKDFTIPEEVNTFIATTLKDKWIRIDEKTIEMLKGLRPPTASPQEDVDRLTKQLGASQEKFKEAWERATLLKITDVLPDEMLDGSSMYHYKVTPDYGGIERFVNEILALFPEELMSKTEQQKKQLQAMIAAIPKLDTFLDASGELWISKKKFTLHKLTVTARNRSAEKGVFSVTLSFLGKNYNKAVAIEAPTDAKSLEEFIGSAFIAFAKLGQEIQKQGGLFGKPPPATPTDNDSDGLSDEEEGRYGTDPNNPDTDGDGHPDGEEVKNGYNPLGPGELSTMPKPNAPATSATATSQDLKAFLPKAPKGWVATNLTQRSDHVGVIFINQSGTQPPVGVDLDDYQGKEEVFQSTSLSISNANQKAFQEALSQGGLTNARREKPIRGNPAASVMVQNNQNQPETLGLMTTAAGRFGIIVTGVGAKREKDLALLRSFLTAVDFDGLAALGKGSGSLITPKARSQTIGPEPAEQLLSFLPAAPAGWKVLDESSYDGNPGDDSTGRASNAKRFYAAEDAKPAVPLVWVNIEDWRGTTGLKKQLEDFEALSQTPEPGGFTMKKTTVNGQRAWEITGPVHERLALRATLMVVVGDRFTVSIGDVPLTQKEILYQFANLIDYERLAKLP